MFGLRLTPDQPSSTPAPTTIFHWPRTSVICCLAAVALFGSGILIPPASHASAPAAVAWHSSLKQALTASASHQRPVLVLFTAEWSPAAAQLKKHVLTDPNAAALLSACFEPLLIDVDANPEVTTELGMKHIPGGCLVRADGTVISRFECPTATGQFIATVARHLQQTDGKSPETTPAANLAGAVTVVAERVEVASDFSTAGSLLADAAATGPTSKSGAVSQIAAKVRGLSEFADAPASVTTTPFRRTAQPYEQSPVPPAFTPRESLASQQTPTYRQAPPSPETAAFNDEAELLASTTQSSPSARSTRPAIAPGAAPAITATARPPQPTTPPVAMPAAVTSPADSSIAPQTSIAASDTSPQAAPWVAEPAQFAADPIQRQAEPSAETAIASSRIIAATPPRPIRDSATNDGLIEPQLVAPAQPQAASPWLAPAAAAVATTAPSVGHNQPAAAAVAAPVPGLPLTAEQPPQSAAPQLATAKTTTQTLKPEPAPSATTENPVLAALQKPFSMFTGRTKEPEQEQATMQEGSAQTARSATGMVANYGSNSSAEEQATTETMPLGLEGYCPVSLVETGNWVEGQAQWGARHRGRTYLFSGLEEQQAFLVDPDRYAPALSGDDPVVAFDSGSTVSGQRQYGVTFQQRIYLFASPESRATFAANPQRYTSRVLLAEQPTSNGGTILR